MSEIPETSLDGIRDVKVYQNLDGYRFSVDAVLLYSFVNVKYAKTIIDLGAGSGIIGLLLAKKYPSAKVHLAELQESLFRLVKRSIALNELNERVEALLTDIRHIDSSLPAMSCDLVVSNPPFRKSTSGRLSIGEERAVARHELKLKLPELIEAAAYLLKPGGRFFMIYHPERISEVFHEFRKNRLEPKRIRFVHNKPTAVSKIVLIEASREGRTGLKIERPLFIYKGDGLYSDEVMAMYEA